MVAAPEEEDAGFGKFCIPSLQVDARSEEESDSDEEMPDIWDILAEKNKQQEAEDRARELREKKLAILERQQAFKTQAHDMESDADEDYGE